MKQLLIPAFALSLTTSPLAAQTDTPTPEEGFSLMEEGAQLLLRGLMSELEPAFDDLQDLATEMGPRMQMLTEQMGPAFAELLGQVDDFTRYHPPEFLPNGDIIMRRRDDAPDFEPELPREIEL
ncbi:hypothetical protein FHS72_000479 [Loktanella ponticola]|uniref:AAA+ family ATPase n=1 Tax=Yoonia ponticola TaxID=1524255 RepID=A0A7W9BI40_9RHOB|nr:hypothetical protein [Yoonia ponticola]MBB5720875.1 hypothetical protein [Yoonia ponticola]